VALKGAVAAALTPLADGGARVDEDAIGPYVDFLAAAGVDGLLALGTTGEGILLSSNERTAVAERCLEAAGGRLAVAVHCGAQTTADTVRLAAHAADAGVDAVAVIGPPYYAFGASELLAHFEAAAAACAPTPFYVYEFERVSGYAVPLEVVVELRERAPNLAGLKVSDSPFEKVAPYLLEGLDVFVGAEALIGEGIAAGAAGAVSGLASALPELVVAAVRDATPEAAERAGSARAALERFRRLPALKRILGLRGVPVAEDVRAPLRRLTDDERAELDRLVPTWLASFATA
jgi:dihydrodipicolinate synthase/N-acetylneuraminate lyase